MTVRHEPCISCRLVGQYAPWAFLIVGAIIGRLPVSAGWQQGSAYLIALALLLLIGSTVLKLVARAR